MSNITERSKHIISEHLGVEPGRVTEDATFDELGADSLDMVELVMGFEEEFNLEIPDNMAEEIKTVKQANEYLAGRLSE